MNNHRRKFIGFIILSLLVGSCIWLGGFAMRRLLLHARAFAYELEQVALMLETAPENPTGAVSQARVHMTAARAELETLRPLAKPVAASAAKLSKIPGLGRPLEQTAALWAFAQAATSMGEELLAASELVLSGWKTDDAAGLMNAMPAAQNHLRAAETGFTQAQAARNQLDTVGWLPADLAKKLNAALNRWDILAPRLKSTLVAGNRLLENVDVAQAWTHTQNLAREFEYVTNLLEAARTEPLTATHQVRSHLLNARAEFEALRPVAELTIARSDQVTDLAASGDLSSAQMAAWWTFGDAVIHLGEELSGATDLLLSNLEVGGRAGVIAAMPTLRSNLTEAEQYFHQAQTARALMAPLTGLPSDLTTSLDTFLARWDTLAPTLEEEFANADYLARVAPLLLGSEKPVTYLLLVQSSDELRATGGFIGGIALLQAQNGRVTDISIGEIMEFDNRPTLQNGGLAAWTYPPEALMRYMGLGHWYLRDANWWADFPASARQAAEFWQVANEGAIDGVIAVTDRSVEAFLQMMGPVKTLDGQPITAQNMKEFATARIYQGDHFADNQSALLHEMTLVFIILTQDLSSENALRLGRYLRQATARHDLLITSFDPPLAAALHKLGIDGAVGGQQDDYFYLVESNVSYNKLSPLIRQDLTYEVELGPDGQPTLSTLTVAEMNTYLPGTKLFDYPESYTNGGRWNPQTRQVEQWLGYYGGYTRLYPPPKSVFIAADGFDDGPMITTEQHRPVIGGYVGLHPGGRREVQFKWRSGGRLSQPGQYRLLVQRQPGAPEHALTVVAHLPPGYRATEITPPPILATDQSVTWQAVLDQDQSFSLTLERAGLAIVSAAPIGGAESVMPTVAPGATPQATALATAPAKSANPAVAIGVTPPAFPTLAPPAPTPPPGRAPEPVWLSVPAIGVEAPVIPVGLEPSGIMASPNQADQVGWYELGPRPGEPSNAILAGHVDWKGEIGSFARLRELEPGDVIEVRSGPETGYRYRVESINAYQTDTAPIAEIFGPTSEAALTLITCGGPYDAIRQEYRDRLVIRARRE